MTKETLQSDYQTTDNKVQEEIRKLAEQWATSIQEHFKKHGSKVGAKSIVKYLRKAKEFLQNHKGAGMRYSSEGTPGAKTYEKKSGEFIIISVSGKILSYGRNRSK